MNFHQIFFCLVLILSGHVVRSEKMAEEAAIIHHLSTNSNLQGKAEIVFLLDRSGSVGKADFETELGFVESFLTHIVVDVNASRVAVISYSDTAKKHIDYLKEPKTKCFLAQEMHDVVYEDSAATNIEAAFEEARNVFKNARPQINKVIVLISDGFYTKGGDPARIADELKAEGVEIFCFGVGKFLQTILTRLASSQQHVYTCSGFKEFKKLARKIRGDPHESSWSSQTFQPNCDHLCDSPYKGDPNDPGCCDPDARCSCALKSGHHSCVCKPGFYGLSGLLGDCTACPRGTYKSKLEPSDRCTPCPLGSITADIRSTKLSDCYCREGFIGDPGNRVPCEVVKCPILQNPTNGYIGGLCNADYGSTCHFMCEHGYDLTDPSSEFRTCKSNGEWTGTTAVCREIRCNPPRPPTFGSMKCETGPFTVGKKCYFNCRQGYIIEGSALRECTSSKQWTGKETNCIPTTCEIPPKLANGQYIICQAYQKPKYRDTCFPRCNPGFELKGPTKLTCTDQGKLVDEYGGRTIPECMDVTPPELFCRRRHIREETDRGKNTATVQWEEPLPTDNSGLTPKLVLSPPHITKNYAFPIGKTVLTYIAFDKAGLNTSCSLLIEVIDREPPSVVECPPNIELSTNHDTIPVFWEEPQFEDNSKKPVRIIYQTYESGNDFELGSRTVKYIAADESGNRKECEFTISVSRSNCKYYPPPNNGALACDDMDSGYMCQVFCEDQYDFQWAPADLYVCNRKAEWETLYPLNAPIPWPDCSRMVAPGAVRKMIGFYYKGDCQDPAVKRAIKKKFVSLLSSRIRGAEICFAQGSCSIDSVAVFCGEMTERRKRDVWQHPEQLELEFEITINADQQLNDTRALMQDFLDILNNLQWDFEEDENLATSTLSPAESVSLERKMESLIPSEDKTILVCKSGSIIKNETCVLCSAGTFYETTEKKCLDCPVGSYQELEGQIKCEKCPEGTSTEHGKSKNETLCKGICSPGTYSMSGLETCLACPIGTFQNSAGMTSCNSCPNGTTTAYVGAVLLDDCKDICPPGTFSPNSLEPCELCPLHHYQPGAGKLSCLECPGELLTAEKGAANLDECLDVDPCIIFDSCLNNGSCIKSGRNAKCDCQQGFEGDHCERDINECSSIPCSNGAQCMNVEGSFFCNCSDGFSGKLCEVELDECASSPCQNEGTCIDQLNGYKCVCSDYFEGDRCEIERELCFRDVVCLNGGVCMPSEGNNSSFCVCEPGFAGIDCSQNIDECENVTCQNNGNCIDGNNSFTCACHRGYKGTFCEIDIDECEKNLCYGASICRDLVDGYKCICPPGWNGTYCETKMNSDFILMFPDSTATIANMATMTLNSPLADATVSLWVQTNDTERSGTPLSYAVASTKSFGADGIVVDNALTISDCSEVKIYVNNEPVMTDLQVADGQWHHLAFTWSSRNSGKWVLYKDGELKYEGNHLGFQKEIDGGGSVVIGQEQDNLGGGFSALETFTGNISRVNIWNSYFSRTNITKLCNMDDDLPDKVLAWPDFLTGLKGNVQVIQNTQPKIS